MPLPVLGSVVVGGLLELGAAFLKSIANTFGSFFMLGATISIYVTLTGLFSVWFLTSLAKLLASMPSLPESFIQGFSFFPTTTLLTCMIFLITLKGAIWMYQLKTFFLISMSKIFYQSISFK